MTLDQLKYFLAAATHEHLGKAAKTNHISVSSISHAIASLEDEFGHTLFVKKGRHVVLTPAGKTLALRAKELLEHAQTVQEEFALDVASVAGTLRVAATHVLSSHLLAPAWQDMAAQFPKLMGELYSLRSAQVLEGIQKGTFDAGVCISPQKNIKLAIDEIHHGRLLPGVRRGHPLARQASPECIRELSSYATVAAKSFPGIEVCEEHPVFKKVELKSPVTITYDNYEVAVAYVRRTDDWALLPDWIIRLYGDVIQSLPVPDYWDAAYNISFVTEKRAFPSRVLEELKSYLRRWVALV